jgi:hypothetical protein
MKVRMFEGGFEEFGATRYQVEWITIKASVSGKESIDPPKARMTFACTDVLVCRMADMVNCFQTRF